MCLQGNEVKLIFFTELKVFKTPSPSTALPPLKRGRALCSKELRGSKTVGVSYRINSTYT